jgi:hypothetical protein
MADEIDVTVADADSDADFGAGFSGKATERPSAKEKPEPAETPRVTEDPEPEHVKITAKEWADIKAAAAKTASYDQQLSRLFGTTGNIQKLLNESKAQATAPTGRKVEIPKDAFAEMEKDFPELAQQTRAALEAALSGVPGTGADVDAGKIEAMLASTIAKREVDAMEEEFPDWFKIVGRPAVPGEPADHTTGFRKWLATKDADYQARINNTESPPVLSRAIRQFQRETKAAQSAPVTPRSDARADRIRAAVQPKGDNAGAAPGKTDEDEFEAGFKSR